MRLIDNCFCVVVRRSIVVVIIVVITHIRGSLWVLLLMLVRSSIRRRGNSRSDNACTREYCILLLMRVRPCKHDWTALRFKRTPVR